MAKLSSSDQLRRDVRGVRGAGDVARGPQGEVCAGDQQRQELRDTVEIVAQAVRMLRELQRIEQQLQVSGAPMAPLADTTVSRLALAWASDTARLEVLADEIERLIERCERRLREEELHLHRELLRRLRALLEAMTLHTDTSLAIADHR